MSSLTRTIDEGLAKIGHEPRDCLLESLGDFERLGLSDEERVSALATSIATSAVAHHRRHIRQFLDAVQVWALEIAAERSPAVPRIRSTPDMSAIVEAADLLSVGLAGLLDALDAAEVSVQDRVVAELTLFTRLLGAHDVNTILLLMGSVAAAVADPTYRAGRVVAVSLRDPWPRMTGTDLAGVPARGVA